MSESAAATETLAAILDLHLLRPDLTDTDIAEGCRIAAEARLRGLLVRPCDVDQVVRWLSGSSVVLAAAVGHPDGVSTTAAKLYEGRDLLRRGARELEWTVNPARMLSRQFQDVETELAQIARSCEEAGAALTVVLLNELFQDDLRIIGVKIAKRVGAARISIRPSAADLQVMRPLLRDRVQLKAGRGVDTLEEALEAKAGGCVSIGSAAAVSVLEAWRVHMQAQQPASEHVS
ncbi:MAG TPA: hypothetical protein VFL57_03180 [Bryobacteraceae bacterium]|nr:hypothetical protein [Bryobacteraceae bacterium]